MTQAQALGVITLTEQAAASGWPPGAAVVSHPHRGLTDGDRARWRL